MSPQRPHRQVAASVAVVVGFALMVLVLLRSAGMAGVVVGLGIVWLVGTAFGVRTVRAEARRQGRAPTVRMLFERPPRRRSAADP